MSDNEEKRISQAAGASEEEIVLFVHDPSPRVIRALLENRRLTERDVLIIANRKNLPGEVLESVFRDKRWAESYPIRLALAKNPKTPLFVALSIARYLRLFDLAEIARSHVLPVVYRRKLEAILVEKIPTVALGVKKTLAKSASGDVLLKLIQDGYPEVVKTCLNNPHLVESTLYKVISRQNTSPGTIKTIAEHPNWSSRYTVKLALLRNGHTPLSRSVTFLPDIRTRDLKDLYADPSVPVSVKPHIHSELWERGEDAKKKEEEQVYEIDEEDEEELEAFEEEGEEAGDE